jgi:hypothetical protein
LLRAEQSEKFQRGRSLDDILNDIGWRGNFTEAAVYDGKNVCSILYMLLPEGAPHDERGEWLLALFVDNKFTKFVRPPEPAPDEMELRYDPVLERDTPVPKPIKVGDATFLIRATESGPVNVAEVQKEWKDNPYKPRSDMDLGLYLLSRKFEPAMSAQWDKDFKKNAALRDRFNAARLRIGMTEEEVESVLNAKPLETGHVEAGSYKIYGSNERLSLSSSLYFSNILVVFRDKRLTVVYGVPTFYEYEWRRKLAERFVDLPKPKKP